MAPRLEAKPPNMRKTIARWLAISEQIPVDMETATINDAWRSAKRPFCGRVPTGSFAADERRVGFRTAVGPVKAGIGAGWWISDRQVSGIR